MMRCTITESRKHPVLEYELPGNESMPRASNRDRGPSDTLRSSCWCGPRTVGELLHWRGADAMSQMRTLCRKRRFGELRALPMTRMLDARSARSSRGEGLDTRRFGHDLELRLVLIIPIGKSEAAHPIVGRQCGERVQEHALGSHGTNL